jgi:lysozyme
VQAAEAEQILKNDLCIYEEAVENAVTAPLSQHQFDALVAWTFNLGAGNLSSSTMLRVLNEGKYEEVPHQMKRWNKAGGQVLEGLVRRRQAEALLFEGQEWHNV